MYVGALRGYEKALGAEHTSTLDIIHNLGILYKNQDKLVEARQMFQQALQSYEKAMEVKEHVDDLQVVPSHLGIKKPPSISKRHKLFRKLGLRFRP
jgi:tetratricopeptide (TPR) repeat protein